MNRYQKSIEMHERALKTVPLASQTFSKSSTQYPKGVAPLFMQRAKGSLTWDVDGNEYIDFVNGLCSVTLGHCDPDVSAAVRRQLDDGVIFSLPHPLEHLVAEKIVEMVPCAEKVRFGKNGSDTTSGAIRLARAHTKRDHVAVCGYHGWQDWYIGSTQRNLGVPQSTRDLTHTFTYNDIDSLDRLFRERKDQYAAVILEPMNTTYPKDDFLAKVKELAHKNGALLVFDETITGFRFANGGAQQLFNVTPDLATFGKGIANGYPLAAIAGRADLMKLMEEIFFSFTFGGETLSLAASLATMTKVQEKPIIAEMTARGQSLMEGVGKRIVQHGLSETFTLAGHPTWSFLLMKDSHGCDSFTLKTLFLQEVFARGILCIGTHNMSHAHSEADIARLFSVYDEVFPILSDALKGGKVKSLLRAEPLQNLFRVR